MNQPKPWLDLDEVTRQLCILTAEQLGLKIDRVKPESRLIEDLHCDSLELLELIMETEDAFGLTIPETQSTPVGKLLFTRSPFRIRDLAEFAFLNQGTGTPKRRGWRSVPVQNLDETPRVSGQLGGRWSPSKDSGKPLFEPLESSNSYPMFRRTSDGMVCVQLPGGEFTIGSDAISASDDEKPAHPISLSPFLIDIEPVSVTAFCRFLNSLDAAPHEIKTLVGLHADDDRRAHIQIDHHNDRWAPKPGRQMQPIVLVTWFAANAYALWANGWDWRDSPSPYGFLPSEAQWEYASQEAFNDPSLIQAGLHRRGETYADGVLPLADVHHPFGVSKFGLRHMSGTVWHWCNDWFDPDFYKTTDAGEPDPFNRKGTRIRSERGGSWVGPLELCSPTYRRGRNPNARGRCLGFRCISSLVG